MFFFKYTYGSEVLEYDFIWAIFDSIFYQRAIKGILNAMEH